MRVEIEYCVECLFLGRALEITKALLEALPQRIRSVALIPGTEGVFTVRVDGEPIFLVGPDGRPPSPEEILRKIEQKIESSPR